MLAPEDQNEDLKYTVKFAKAILWIIGAWPLHPATPTFVKIQNRIKIVIVYFLFSFTIVPGLLRIFLIEKTAVEIFRILGPVLNSIMQFTKYTILLCRAKEIRKCLELIDQDWKNAVKGDREILLSKAKDGRKVVLMSAIAVYVSGLGFRIFIPLTKETIITADNHTIRPLAVSCYLVVLDHNITPIYETVFVLQVFAGLASYSMVTGSSSICTILVLHVCSKLKILMTKINKLTEGKNLEEETVHQKIAEIVEYQIQIKGLLAEVERITEYICLVEILGGVFLICLTEYYVLLALSGPISNVIIYTIMLYALSVPVFMLCYISQLLDNESQNVGQASNTLDWYRLPTKQARDCVLIIAMSNCSKMLSAAKMIDLSLATFTDIMKGSVVYLNMLREM